MRPDNRVFVAGSRGLVGSAIVRRLQREKYARLLLPTRRELDLEDQHAVADYFERERPEYVFLAAAKVGGILANNDFPAEFIRSNLTIQLNVIEAARKFETAKLLFLGSSCIYPKLAPQPIREEYLLTGPLEPTNQPYAIAKIAGLELCRSYNRQFGTNFISVMPTNLYGPGDNFDLKSSHVLPALMRKFHAAKVRGDRSVELWGTGSPRREFLHADDLADACVLLMQTYDSSDIINIGCGADLSIRELAELVREVVGFEGAIEWDSSKPDGTPRKLLDVSRLFDRGWRPSIPLRQGIEQTYEWFLRNVAEPAVPELTASTKASITRS